MTSGHRPLARRVPPGPACLRIGMGIGGVLLLLLPRTASSQGAPVPSVGSSAIARAVQEIEGLDAMRATLARTFAAGGVAATDSTFAQVCKPVKGKAMALAKETGWSIAQLAERNRNPDNQLDAEARGAFRQFQRDPGLTSVVRHTTYKGVAGTRYLRRITVDEACLACHGVKEQRPAFVQKQYPADRAFGFVAGDLRGVYSVFIPDTAMAGGRR